MPRTIEQIERDLRRASIAIRLFAEDRCAAARVTWLREEQDRWLEEWVKAHALVTK